MFVVDTNVLLYAADADSPDHHPIRKSLEKWRRAEIRWYVTWPIVYEFLRVATHPRVFHRPRTLKEAWTFIEVLLETPSLGLLTPTPRHADLAHSLVTEYPSLRGNVLHDAHTVALMREHGIRRIITRDSDFRRFHEIEVVDPIDMA